ncbi:MAG: peptide chain release factor 1 [Acidimicrobiia bacterium]|nr:peptide chain release factor 1 [Acidimicrobiia bacterium]
MIDEQLATKMAEVEASFDETLTQMADPDVAGDQARYTEVAKHHAELRPVVETYHAYQAAIAEADEAQEMARAETDESMLTYLREQASAKQEEAADLIKKLQLLLVPKDPNDDKDVIIEVRAAAGGDEAALWAADLSRMYQRYAENHGWKSEHLGGSDAEGGGFKEVTFAVKGTGAFSRLKYEAGVHRVQRVPKTESQGRIHTSTASVAVLPEAEAVEVELDVNDVKVDVFRSSGPGGQSVNTTDSAIRLTHVPTGIKVSCQDEKSQLQNKEKAFRILRARLYQNQLDAQQAELSANRREQVGTGDRSEKIRTYNFKENRVTDHRIGLTINQLPTILEGDLDAFVDALTLDHQARVLSGGDPA